MKIILSTRAEKELKKITKIDQIAIARKLRSFYNATNQQREEKLKGFQNIFRLRVGNYRIVYKKGKDDICIVLIGHRKDIYELLSRLFKQRLI